MLVLCSCHMFRNELPRAEAKLQRPVLLILIRIFEMENNNSWKI